MQDELPTIFAITPTYARPVQKAELTRLSQTFLHVTNLHWILVEDSSVRTSLVKNFVLNLNDLANQVESGLKITHLNVETPAAFKTRLTDPNWKKPRGVLQRNAGIDWLRDHFKEASPSSPSPRGVIYFADDDNTYDLKLFEEMRSTRKISIWPVGLVGGLNVEKPLVEDGVVVGWNTQWEPQRPFPIDMAGFALNLQHLLERPQARFTYNIRRGYQESHIISQIINDKTELEPKAANCTRILVWHTRTENPKLGHEQKLKVASNHGMEL